MIVIMLSENIRKILSNGESNVSEITADIAELKQGPLGNTITFNIGGGKLEVPWFTMSGDNVSADELITPSRALLVSDELNPNIFTIRSFEQQFDEPIVEPDLKQPQEDTDQTEKEVKNESEKCQSGGGSKSSYQGCNYEQKHRNW